MTPNQADMALQARLEAERRQPHARGTWVDFDEIDRRAVPMRADVRLMPDHLSSVHLTYVDLDHLAQRAVEGHNSVKV